MQAKTQSSSGLRPVKLISLAAAALPVGALVTTLAVYLPNYYASHLGLSLASVGVAFMVVRLLDIVFDPALGIVMDGSHSPIGKFRPWLAASAPILFASTFALFLAPVGVGQGYLVLWLLALYAGFSMLVLSQAAWGAALVAEYHARSRIYGWIQVVGVVGAISVLVLPALVKALAPGVHVPVVAEMGWFILAIVPISALVTVFGAPEPPRKKLEARGERFGWRDYASLLSRPTMLRILGADLFCTLGPAITAPLYLFFFEDARGYSATQATTLLLVYVAAGLVAPTFWARVAKRLGKHQTIRLSSIAYVFAQSGLLMVPHAHVAMMSVAMFTVGFIASSFSFLVRAMVADVSDEVRLETGKDRTSVLYALETSSAKIGSTVSVGIAYTILPLFGFNAAEGVVNTPDAIWGLQACYLVPPVVCVLIGGLFLWGYKLDAKRHGEIRDALGAIDGVAIAPQLNPGE